MAQRIHNIFPIVFMAAISVMPVMFIHMPRALSFVPLLFGIIMSIWWVFWQRQEIKYCSQYVYCVLAVSFLCIVSSLWSVEPMGTYKQAVKVSAILLFSIPLFNFMRSLDYGMIKLFSPLFPIGVILASILASFELALDMPIYRAAHALPHSYALSSAVMNRGIISTVFLFFIAILFIRDIANVRLRYSLLMIMSVTTVVMLALSQCQSGQLAFVLGIIVLFLFPHKIKHSYKFIAFSVVAVMLLTPVIVHIMYTSLIDNAQEIPWLKDGYAGNRIEIWNFVMKYALNNPLYGYGMEATRFIPEFEHDYIYHKGPTILHPHNFSVQIWIEFGIIGIILAGALIIFLVNKIDNLILSDKKIIISLFIAVLAVASNGYGLWQSWWIGELLFLISLCAFVKK